MDKISFLLLAACVLAASCQNRQKAEEVEPAEDTIVVVEPEMLPDTMFESARALDFSVELADTAMPGVLQFTHHEYADSLGGLTFRANNLRNADFGGRIKGTPTRIVKKWVFNTASNRADAKFGPWGGGTGWTGQPIYVRWPAAVYEQMRKSPAATADFSREEIILASLCGNIYFLNPENGRETREAMDAGSVVKGSPSLDASMNGNLYVGHGVPVVGHSFGSNAFSLLSMKRFFFMERDGRARRGWNAFDSSPVCAGGFLFWPGENGTLYKYCRSQEGLTLHSAMRYSVNGAAPGMESSMAVYSNYGYVSDNHGNIVCVNLNTMRPVWRYDNRDDSDSSPVVEVEDGHPYVFSGCEVDKRGDGATARTVKLDGLTGREIWLAEEPCMRWHCGEKKIIDGGVFGTPLPGLGDCKDLLFVNICKHGRERGIVAAYSKKDGKEKFRTQLKCYAWSSMVPFCNEKGEMYIFLGDCVGNVYLIRGRDGSIIYTEAVANNFESSPVVFGNSCVIGSRGNGIYKFSIE